MPRELVCLQVGQCGNQIGCKFWDLALQEHIKYKTDGAKRQGAPDGGKLTLKLDDAMSSFFYNGNPKGSSDAVSVSDVKARAVPIDMEEGVLNSLLQGSLKSLFDRKHCIASTSGCGNNWAVGYECYGAECLEDVMETVRHLTEDCDSLQSFLMLHSLGGGTGSGFGTRVLEELCTEYPSIYRFVSPVFPQRHDDVVTSPYNSVLSLAKLVEFADCVLPVDNQQLAEIAAQSQGGTGLKRTAAASQAESDTLYGIADPKAIRVKKRSDRRGGEAFDSMNFIVASMLTHLTASMRFHGPLNVDLNEITTNLVPFPRLHFLHTAVAPIALSKLEYASGTKHVNDLFRSAFDRRCQLLTCPDFKPTYFASCMLLRGDVSLSDATSNIDRLRKTLNIASWNREGFKVGMCAVPAVEQPVSLLSVTNNSGIIQSFKDIQNSFLRLYTVGAHLHHYTEYLEKEEIDAAHGTVQDLIESYSSAANLTTPFDCDDVAKSDRLLF